MAFAFLFPGQGSQSLNMMDGFAAPIVKETFDEASEALGEDLWAMLKADSAEAINQTINTQPLMLAAGVATYRAWLAAGGATPTHFAGHSLGEYSALVAADALDFDDAVRLVRLRAEAMQSAVPAGEGAMAAVLGLDDAEIVLACAEAAAGDVVSAVNFNAPGQVVIAGRKAAGVRAIAARAGVTPGLIRQAVPVAGFQFLQARNRLLDGTEVGQHATQPTLRDERHATAGRFFHHDVTSRALGADEQDVGALLGQLGDVLHRFVELRKRLFQIDDVELAAGTEDVRRHLGVPVAGLVAEMNAGFQHLAHGD